MKQMTAGGVDDGVHTCGRMGEREEGNDDGSDVGIDC